MSERLPGEKSELTRRALLATIQHELRTPATNIIGYARVLREESSPDYADDLGQILKASKQILEQINHFLELKQNAGVENAEEENDLGVTLRHDFRSPLNVILGYVDFLTEEAEARNDTRVKRDLLHITRLTKKMLNVVDLITGTPESENTNEQTLGLIHSDLRLVTQAMRSLENLEITPEQPEAPARILVVDDNDQNRDLLSRHLHRDGHTVEMAEDGRMALEMLGRDDFDLVLLDIVMPELDGYQVLAEIKAHDRLRQIPVIMISALDDIEGVVRCIELGADEYLPKSFNPALLRARLAASLEKKRLRDREQHFVAQLRIERERAERLLNDVLPEAIVKRLKDGEKTIADDFDTATVLFCDLVGFTEFSAELRAAYVVRRLNEIFLRFDDLVEKHGLEKIKTIGDAYLVVAGVPAPDPNHARALADLALEMREKVFELNQSYDDPLQVRIGMHTGPIVAGVIGRKRFTYDVWGDTVNIASRMESHGVAGKIQVSESTYRLLEDAYVLEPRGSVPIKGRGKMKTYFLLNAR